MDRMTTRMADVLDGKFPLEDFIASMAHDAMQPIAAALMMCETLRDDELELPPEDRAEMLDGIHAQLAYMRDLCNWMAHPFDLQRVQIGAFAERVAERCRPSVGEHKIAVNDLTGGTVVTVEPVRLESALRNLARNAADHAPAKSTIVFTVELDDDEVVLSVTDEGRGIPVESWERIFERRVQLDPRSEVGSGLGLFLVRRYAERFGGSAQVVRSDGSGTTVQVRLPQEPPPRV